MVSRGLCTLAHGQLPFNNDYDEYFYHYVTAWIWLRHFAHGHRYVIITGIHKQHSIQVTLSI